MSHHRLRPGSALAVAAAVALAAGLSACSPTSTSLTAPTNAAPTHADAAQGPASTPEAPDTPDDEPAPEDPADELGTRDNPAAIGQTVTFSEGGVDEWTVTLGKPVLNANAAVHAANQFNEAAPKGMQFAMVPVTVKRLGKDSATPWVDLTVDFVSADGTTHEPGDVSVVAPEPDFDDLNEMYAGATGTGNVVIAVPTKGIAQGTWVVSMGFDDSSKTFFKAS
jgi:hypothetical protein